MTRTSQNDSRARLRAHLDAEDGVAMILALVILIVIAIVGGSVIFFSSSNARSAEYSAANSGAHSLAESGIANAMAVISHPASNRANASLLPQTTTTYDEGDVVWSGAYDPVFAVWTLTSTAYISNPSAPNDVDRTVTAKVWTADTVFTSTLDPDDGTTDREIWVMNLDGSGKYNVTDNDWEDGDAFWSPDTGTFVYETEKDKDAVANAGKSNAGGPSNMNREIYSMNVDGSGQTRLTVNQGVAGQKCSSADEDPDPVHPQPNQLLGAVGRPLLERPGASLRRRWPCLHPEQRRLDDDPPARDPDLSRRPRQRRRRYAVPARRKLRKRPRVRLVT